MARLVRPVITSYTLNGKRVPKGTPGAKETRQKAPKWYAQGVPGYPPKKRFPHAKDKQVAKRMLADLVAGAERGMPDAEVGRIQLADHLAKFSSDLWLELASRPGKGKKPPSDEQVALVTQRMRDGLEGCKFANPGDLNDSAPAKRTAYLRGRVKLPSAEDGISE